MSTATFSGPIPAVEDLFTVATRELRTLVRTKSILAVTFGFMLAVFGIAAVGTGGSGGFVPLTIDLLTIVEVLIPVLSFAVGYRAILDDRSTGELDMLRTYSLSRASYVGGVFVGRALGLGLVVFVTLLLAGLAVPLLAGNQPSFLASNAAADSVWLYVRFVVVAELFALVTLAIAVAVSATARSFREALALVVALLLVLVVGFDTATVVALSGDGLSGAGLDLAIALSPNSAFRSLVLDVVVGAASETGRTGNTVLNVVGLFAWLAAALVLSTLTVWRR